MNRHVVISGCSGGGKSTLISELKRRGYAVIEEPGRRIVEEELAGSGQALPWINLAAFAERAIELSLRDRQLAKGLMGTVFFDRSLIDAVAALEFATGRAVWERYARERYYSQVFLTPPWPEIYRSDDARQHDFQAAAQEYERLLNAYSALGYTVDILPKISVGERADMVVERLGRDLKP